MTYTELSVIGRLRKISMCGPFSMFCKLIHLWKDLLSPVEVGFFFFFFLLFLSFGQMFLPTMSCPLNFIFFSLLNCIWNFFYIHMHHLRDIQAHPVNKETTGSAKLSLEKVVNPKICGGEAGLEKYWLVKHTHTLTGRQACAFYTNHVSCAGGPEGETLFLDVFGEPPQDDNVDTGLPRRELQSRWQPLWPSTFPL